MTDSNSQNKIGIVLVTHGNLAIELVKVMEHVVGPQDQLATVSIGPDDDMEKRREDILNSVQSVDRGLGVIILTDMFGGTPSNLAISIMEQAKIDIVAGVNLPMLVKLASVRSSETMSEAVTQARDAGQKYIMVASQVLSSSAGESLLR
ncbi:PTS sugar transporter subunit IIA [Alphaproteobacteria bacterium]|nr:PTS sugar transporter subunit IIA [Alphaproteobacteria bacterium]